MEPRPDLDQFQEIIEKIGPILITEIDRKLREKKLSQDSWMSAYLDARWTSDGNSRIAKVRIVLGNGNLFAGVRIPYEAELLLSEIGKMKDGVFPDKWYGLKLTLWPNGKCQTDFNYDCECSVDPHFFDLI